MQIVFSELVKSEVRNRRADVTKKPINNVIGVPWRLTDGKWTVGRPEDRVNPIPLPPSPFEGARVQRKRITKQDIDEFGAAVGCPEYNTIKTIVSSWRLSKHVICSNLF